MDDDLGLKRDRDDADDLEGLPSLKRKKTVTWADGDDADGLGLPLPGDDSDGDGGGGGAPPLGGAAAEFEPAAADAPADPLFASLDLAAALADQAPLPKTEAEPLARAALLRRRLAHLDALARFYEDEAWALADELRLRRAAFEAEGGSGAPAAVPASPEVAAAAAGAGGARAAWEALEKKGAAAAGAPPPRFEALEALALSLPPADGAARGRLVASRAGYVRRLAAAGRLEQAALAAAARELDARGAVAALVCAAGRFLLRRTAVALGRAPAGARAPVGAAPPDVDLTLAGGGRAVSRRTAHVFLDAGGAGWRLRRVGRRGVEVNGAPLARGEAAPLPHLSLVAVAGVRLLFVENRAAVARLSGGRM